MSGYNPPLCTATPHAPNLPDPPLSQPFIIYFEHFLNQIIFWVKVHDNFKKIDKYLFQI